MFNTTRLVTLLIIGLVNWGYAQPSLQEKLPVDEKVKIGQLDNGLTYYIRENKKPENKLELRLVLKAGSILENEKQLGLAHFIEHMCFNGTKNFEKNELVDYLESIGIKFGADLNAYTSFDETVFMLPIPTDKEEYIENGFQILEDWAHNVSFEHEEIDKERGVVEEEWRLRRGAQQRMRDQYFPVLLKGSRYAQRLPIGKMEVIRNFPYEEVKTFYRDWYRPDLMAVIAVGDWDLAKIEEKIKQHFGRIAGPENPKKRTYYDIPDNEGTLVSIATDKEASITQVQLIYKHEQNKTKTVADFRRNLVHSLYNSMISARFTELSKSAKPPFLGGGSYYGNMLADKNAYQGFATIKEGELEKGLKALVRENERVKQHGFTNSELERTKKQLLVSYERSFKERDKAFSGSYLSQYMNHFLKESPIPGIAYQYETVKNLLPTIQLEEINALPKKWMTEQNRVLIVTAPEKEKAHLPDETQLLKLIEEVEKENITPYEDKLTATALMEATPKAGKVLSEKVYERIDVKEITLSNGIKVVLKATDFKNDQISFSAFSQGGTSLSEDDNYQSAVYANTLVREGGVKDFSPIDLRKLLAGKVVGVAPYINTLEEGISGNASPKDLETALQLVHLYFTAPRKDQESAQSFINKYKAYLKNALVDPQAYYNDQLAKLMSQNHPRGGGYPTVEDLDKINLDKAITFYQERFADASDFTFFFVGNLDESTLIPLVETYLGSLPNLKRQETWKDEGIRPPKGVISQEYKKGKEEKSTVRLMFTGKAPYSREAARDMQALGEILTIRLTESLREEKSGVYGAGAGGGLSKRPYENYSFSVSFGCAPENVDELVAATFIEMKKLQKEGPSAEDLEKVKKAWIRQWKENLKKNGYWMGVLQSAYRNAFNPESVLDYEKNLKKVTAKSVKKAAKRYFNFKNYVQAVLKPEQEQ
ncbi:insulinase family protein [Rapidithrix thailandica]|uniref:Insulinase family protein n=1 Tax=Rapidithrix thailandica TaxID=413964 RepID=A0AAW9RVQ4_9BACT